jgi:hypothetical protein
MDTDTRVLSSRRWTTKSVLPDCTAVVTVDGTEFYVEYRGCGMCGGQPGDSSRGLSYQDDVRGEEQQ